MSNEISQLQVVRGDESVESSCEELHRPDTIQKKRRLDKMRWKEFRWDGITQTGVTIGCNEQIPREATMQWDLMKWEKIQHSKGMAPECQGKRLLLQSTEGPHAPYRQNLGSSLQAMSVSILKLPPPPCPGTTCNRNRSIWYQAIFG